VDLDHAEAGITGAVRRGAPPGSSGIALGATGCQPPAATASRAPPRQGTSLPAFLPAWASCMPGTAPFRSMKAAIGAQASACSSFQMPASDGEIRPSRVTAEASVNTSAAPPTARLPRWAWCHSFGMPSTDEYWHIGDTTTLLRSVTERCVSGSKSAIPAGTLTRSPLFPLPRMRRT
jgi:hypothetical protein